MPFYLHRINEEATAGTPYDTKDQALADRQDGQTITFVASESERQTWIDRESSRMSSGHYVPVPWADVHWATKHWDHFAHVSLDVPGMIAYTPDDAHGVADRQIRVKPGKYLQKFCADHLTADDVNDWASRVKSYTADLQLATTPDDIARVYCSENGPTSCMSRDSYHQKFDFETHPTRVYGNSDLAVAYIGTLGEGETDSRIAARAVVWPANKIWSRIYGDTATLQHVLTKAGYSEGDVDGSRVRAIRRDRGGYYMPYVDGVSYAELDGKWFVLGSGEYATDNTDGSTDEEDSNTCANCGDRCGEDDTWCQSCDNDRQYCEHCGNDYFGDDASSGHYSEERSTWFCESCYDNHSHTCQHCEESFNEYDFSRRDWNGRNNDLCGDCHDSVGSCTECGDYSDDLDDADYCRDCRKCSECGDVCDQADDRDSEDRCEDCHDSHNKPLTPARPIGRVLRLHRVGVDGNKVTIDIPRPRTGDVVAVTAEPIGVFYLHQTIDIGSRHWTLTHGGTKLAVTTLLPNDQAGRDLARELADLDWSFTNDADMAYSTRSAAVPIIARYRATA